MIPWTEAVGRWLIDYYILSTPLLVIAVLGSLLVKQPSRWMQLSWAVTFGSLVLGILTAFQGFVLWVIPVFTSPTYVVSKTDNSSISTDSPHQSIAMISDRNSPEAADGPGKSASSAPSISVVEPQSDASQPITQGTTNSSETQSWLSQSSLRIVIAQVFAGTIILLASWQLLGAALTVRLLRISRIAPDAIQSALRQVWPGASHPPIVLMSSEINQALATGMLNPVILLPEWFEGRESPSSIQAVLAHEASHISHGDLWLRALQRILMLALWAHPLFWMMRALTMANQEYLADAAARGQQPLDYAEILLHWFRTGASARNKTLTATVGLWERPHLLKRRISMVLNENYPIEPSCPPAWRWAVPSAFTVLVLILSSLTLHAPSDAQAQDKSNKKPKSAKSQGDKKEIKSNGDQIPKVGDETPITPLTTDDQLKFTDEQIAKAKAKYTSAEEAFGVGAAHYNSRNFAASREPLEAAAILGAPADIEYRIKVYGALMASYRQLGTIEPFVTVTEYIIRHSERDAEQSLTRRSLLSFLHERGKVEPFIKRHEDQLKKNPKDRLSLYLLSEVYSRMRENPARSIELLKQLAEVDGQPVTDDVVDVSAQAKLAMQYVRAKELEKGAELYEKIAPHDKKLAAWHWKEAATAWLKLKRNDKALAAAKQSADSEPEKRSELLTHFWHRHLGDVFLAVGEAKLAVPQFEQAIASTKIEGYLKDCNASLAEARKKAEM